MLEGWQVGYLDADAWRKVKKRGGGIFRKAKYFMLIFQPLELYPHPFQLIHMAVLNTELQG